MVFMKNSYSIIIVILVIIIAVLSLMLVNTKRDEKISEVINQVNQIATTTMTTPQSVAGLDIKVLTEGNGPEAKNGDTVFVHYTGKLTDGSIFDSSHNPGRGEPLDFVLGSGRVIPGWEKGVLGMKVGEKRVLTIAPELAYGERGVTSQANGKVIIPSNATLVFDVELMEIQ